MDKDKARKTPEKLKIKLKRNKEKKGKKMRNDRIIQIKLEHKEQIIRKIKKM